MYLPCSEKCLYNVEGNCKKDNCNCDIGIITGANSCPFNVTLQRASTDRKHFSMDKSLSVSGAF